MRPRVLRSLTARIILESLVLLACLFAAIVAGGAYFQQSIIHEMEAKSTEILKGLQVEVGQARGTPLDDLLMRLREQQEVDAILLFDEDREMAASAHSPRLTGAAVEGPGQGLEIRRLQGPAGPLTAYVQTLPIEAGGQVVGYVKVAIAIAPQTAVLQAFRSRVLWGLITVFLLTTGALCYSVAAALRPLRKMSDHLQAVGDGRLQPVTVDAASSEVAVLQERFNTMVAALAEKEALAERLRQSQRLSALGNLAAGVAHDIGNPLNALRLTSSHLLEILNARGAAETPEARRYVEAIGGEVERLDGLVRDFLTLAREQTPRLQSEEPDRLLEDVLRLVRAEARRRDIALEEDLNAPAAAMAMDAAQLKGALVNILVNAFEAAGPGGVVAVRTSRENGHVQIAIRDTGPGIPPALQARIFEPYFTTKPDGTGLGLALARTVVEQHGGTLAVESHPGEGTTMTIRLGGEADHV